MTFFEVPVVERKPWGFICAFSNLLPGFGTLVAAGRTGSVRQYVFGMVQFLFFWTILGYLWSLVWGVMIFVRSTATETTTVTPTPTPKAKGRAKKA